MSDTPEDLYYAKSHEWLKLNDDGTATVGISDFAQSELGDVVFVELPEVGAEVTAKAEISVVESVKTATDIYSPVSGEVTEVNEALQDNPELINELPYESGWIFKLQVSDEAELTDLLNAGEYNENCEEG